MLEQGTRFAGKSGKTSFPSEWNDKTILKSILNGLARKSQKHVKKKEKFRYALSRYQIEGTRVRGSQTWGESVITSFPVIGGRVRG